MCGCLCAHQQVLVYLGLIFSLSSFLHCLVFYLYHYFVCHRDAVVAVDRTISKENDNFQPYKRTRLYGITTALAQCPAGNGANL